MGLFDFFKKKKVVGVCKPIEEQEPELDVEDNSLDYRYSLLLKSAGERQREVVAVLVGSGINATVVLNAVINNVPSIVKIYSNRIEAEKVLEAILELGADAEIQEIELTGDYSVILKSVERDRISVIKVLHESLAPIDLKEVKEIIDKLPKIIKTGISKNEAESLKKALEYAGAELVIKDTRWD